MACIPKSELSRGLANVTRCPVCDNDPPDRTRRRILAPPLWYFVRVGILRSANDLLTSPARGLTDPVEKGSARLLSACIAALSIVFGGLDIILTNIRPGYVAPWQGYVMLAVSYAFSRSVHYRWGAILTTTMFPLVAVSIVITGGPSGVRPFSYALLAPFFASLFLGVRGATIFAVVTPATVALVSLTFGIRFDEFVDTLAANLMGGLVAVSYALHRDWVEQRRNEVNARHEAEIIHMQKMEAIGRMAGGIAHDFNNLLTVIAGGAELLSRTTDRKELKLIESATRSAQDLTEQLLTLSRQPVVGNETTDVAEALDGTQQLLSRIIGEDVRLEVLLDPELGSVNLSKGQLQQVLLNLATNARDAMPRGGVLTFEARGQDENLIRLSVRDTGVGMPESVRLKVFEPFFTTKRVGEGTGLGLAMVFGLVTQAGGTIEVQSRLGEGTTFNLLIPRAQHLLEEPAILSDRRLSLGGTSRGRILLVEDDASVRELCRSVLRKEGFEVLDAAEPQEALLLFLNSEERCDLVITDVVMPGMSGPELVEALRRLVPDLPALFVSGYAPEEVVGEGLSGAFLPKPFRPTELLRKVCAMLYGLDSQAPPAVGAVQKEGDPIPPAPLIPSELPTFTTEPPLSGAVKKGAVGSRGASPGAVSAKEK